MYILYVLNVSKLCHTVTQTFEICVQAADERHKDHVDKLNQIIQDLQQTLLDKEHEWVTSREPAQVKEEQTRSRSMLLGSEPTLGFSVEDKQMQVVNNTFNPRHSGVAVDFDYIGSTLCAVV